MSPRKVPDDPIWRNIIQYSDQASILQWEISTGLNWESLEPLLPEKLSMKQKELENLQREIAELKPSALAAFLKTLAALGELARSLVPSHSSQSPTEQVSPTTNEPGSVIAKTADIDRW